MRTTCWIATIAGLLCSWQMAVGATAAESVTVEDVYVRAVPPGLPNSAAFMVLVNPEGVTHAVIAAASPAASVVELHTHTLEQGMMQMRRIDSLIVEANGKTVLQPGGLHIMLINLQQALILGESVELTLTFEDGSSKRVAAPVRKVMTEMQPTHGGMHSPMH
jgi:copper(I)-binding protein